MNRYLRYGLCAGILLANICFSAGAVQLTDVSQNSPYCAAVAWATEQGIVKGTSKHTFEPDRPITADEFNAMFIRTYHKGFSDVSDMQQFVYSGQALCLYTPDEFESMRQKLTREKVWSFLADATDFNPYPAWMYSGEEPKVDAAADIEAGMYRSGLYADKVDPQGTPTRGEIVSLLYRLQQHDYKADTLPEAWRNKIVLEDGMTSKSWQGRNIVFADMAATRKEFFEILKKNGWKVRLTTKDLKKEYNLEHMASGVCSYYEQEIAIDIADARTCKNVWFHEVGHALPYITGTDDMEHNMFYEVDGVEKVIGSSYCRTNSSEMSAEVFKYLMSNADNPKRLKTMQEAAPYSYAYVMEGFLDSKDGCDEKKINQISEDFVKAHA